MKDDMQELHLKKEEVPHRQHWRPKIRAADPDAVGTPV